MRRARTEELCGAALHLFLQHGLRRRLLTRLWGAGVSKGILPILQNKEALVAHLFTPLTQDRRSDGRTLSIRQAPEAAQAYLAYVQVGVALAGILSRHRNVSCSI